MSSNRLRCILLVILLSSGCRERVLHDLDEHEANRLVARLHESQISANKEKQSDGKWSISAPTSQSINAIQRLGKERRWQTLTPSKLAAAGPLTSRSEQQFRYERGLSREIERTLASIEGVLEARVHLNLPLPDPIFGRESASSESSASVLLLTSASLSLSSENIAGLIGGAAGISTDKITVLMSPVDEPDLQEYENVSAADRAEIPPAASRLLSGFRSDVVVQGGLVLIIGGALALIVSWVLRATESRRICRQ